MSNSNNTLVFVYGSLLSGLLNSSFLDSSKQVGKFVTQPRYKMYDLGCFPCIVLGGDTAIKGEVYEVTPDVLDSLDMLEGHPDFYKRRRIQTSFGRAWVYEIPDDQHGATRVADGDWRAYRAAF